MTIPSFAVGDKVWVEDDMGRFRKAVVVLPVEEDGYLKVKSTGLPFWVSWHMVSKRED